ncbi:MAG: hypothetical protein QXR63_03845, partial [Candidatus Bathyarchaeia archaeon]
MDSKIKEILFTKLKILTFLIIIIFVMLVVPRIIEIILNPSGNEGFPEPSLVQIVIASTPYDGQSPDLRIGLEIPETSTRYSSSPNMNFLGTYGFEAYRNTEYGEIANDWLLWSDGDWPAESTRSTATLSKDGTPGNFVHGKYAQKIEITNYVEPIRLGQYQSGRMFLANRVYKFGCWMKQNGLTEDVRLRIRFWSGDTNIDVSQNFAVSSEWKYYEMEFVIPFNYTPIDPYYGQASSERIEIFSAGT